jgi:hypothetical protein
MNELASLSHEEFKRKFFSNNNVLIEYENPVNGEIIEVEGFAELFAADAADVRDENMPLMLSVKDKNSGEKIIINVAHIVSIMVL